MSKDSASIADSVGSVAAGREIGPLVLVEIAEVWAEEIEAVAEGLLEAAMATDKTAQNGGEDARRLQRAVGRLGSKLHAHLGAARDWQHVISEKPLLDGPHLDRALNALRRSVDRASLLLLQSDIVLATPDRAPAQPVATADNSHSDGRRRASRESGFFTTGQPVTQTLAGRRAGAKGVPATTREPATPRRYAPAA